MFRLLADYIFASEVSSGYFILIFSIKNNNYLQTAFPLPKNEANFLFNGQPINHHLMKYFFPLHEVMKLLFHES